MPLIVRMMAGSRLRSVPECVRLAGMLLACLALLLASFLLAWPATMMARSLGHRLSAMDGAGVVGQVKAPVQRIPNIGGLGIFWPIAILMAAGLLAARTGAIGAVAKQISELPRFVAGISEQSGSAAVLLLGALVLHVLGLVDDRRPMGPWVKLVVLLGVIAVVVQWTDSRVLTFLDGHVGGAWLSILLSVLWVGVITNAMNFLDNMDGLSGGVATICGGVLLTAAIAQPQPQWFVAAMLALLVGACAGFLMLNFPWSARRIDPSSGERTGGATIFMGDGGSLVIGFLLGVLSMRITYVPPGEARAISEYWHLVLIPVVVLAVPLYDFVSVVVIRLSQGKSPLVGDLQHFSHRLVKHGLSSRSAVLVIYGCTGITGLSGLLLTRVSGVGAGLVFAQVALTLGILAMYEWSRSDRGGGL
jgi:UDP-GlcNAc:undecaprenyl-phosphate/decaprenyl-phosphate GlcNAc-1-phosphate transferase